MNRKKLDPSEAELRASAINADKWKTMLAPDEDKTGWNTSNEIAKMIGLKSSATMVRIKQKIEEGKCEKRDFFIIEDGGQRRIKPHYRIIE